MSGCREANPSGMCPSRWPTLALVCRAAAPLLLTRVRIAELAQPWSKVLVASTPGIDEKEIAAATEPTQSRELTWSSAGDGLSGDGSSEPALGHMLPCRGTPSKAALGPLTAQSTPSLIAPHGAVEIGSDALSPDQIRVAYPQPFAFAHGDRFREAVRRRQEMSQTRAGLRLAKSRQRWVIPGACMFSQSRILVLESGHRDH